MLSTFLCCLGLECFGHSEQSDSRKRKQLLSTVFVQERRCHAGLTVTTDSLLCNSGMCVRVPVICISQEQDVVLGNVPGINLEAGA